MRRLIIGAVAFVFLMVLVFSSFFVVPPSEMAGVRWMGGKPINSVPYGPGVHFKMPFLETVDFLQTSQSTYQLPNLSVYTNDNQEVNISISVIYQIPGSSVMHLLYDVGRSGSTDVNDTIIPVVRDRALAVFARYNTLNISDKRTEISLQMKKEIAIALNHLFGIQVLNVQLTGIRYSPVFVTSVENAVKAKAMAVQAENTVLQKKYEGEQMTVTAKAQADARIEAARGEAQSTLLEAQAQAKAIQMVGQAIQENPHYVEFYSVKQWNGILPTYMGGGAPVPFVKVPQASHSSN